jgi:two-component SAPR family response regulator
MAYLTLQQGQPISRQELVKALWPNMEWATALRNLNTTVYQLRRSLEPTLKHGAYSRYIFYESGCYWLGGDGPHWVDVTAFKSYIKQARAETAVPQAITLYQKAIQLYRGDYLADVIATGISSFVKQNRLHQLFLAALEEVGKLYQQQEQDDKARDTYLKILTLDPYRESVCQQLALLSQSPDSRLDSLAYCQRLAATLKDELDLILGQELQDHHNRQNSRDK